MFLPNSYGNLGNTALNPFAAYQNLQTPQVTPQFQQPIQQPMQQIQQPVQPQMQTQPQYTQIGNNGKNMNYDFQGKQVGSYEEVRNYPVPIDGRPTVFVDDINGKLYFKYISANGDITIQSFTITSDDVKTSVDNGVVSDVNTENVSYVTKTDFDTFKKELLEEIKGGK